MLCIEARTDEPFRFDDAEFALLERALNDWLELYAACYGTDLEATHTSAKRPNCSSTPTASARRPNCSPTSRNGTAGRRGPTVADSIGLILTTIFM